MCNRLIRSFVPTLLLMLLVSTSALAQTADRCTEALLKAQQEYENGYFENASDRLYACIGKNVFSDEDELRAYLLLGRIHFANLQHAEARDSIRRALDINPAIELEMGRDKPGFVNLLEEVRATIEPPRGPAREGFWLSFGIGPAGAEMDCSGCGLIATDDPWNGGPGGSFHLAMGGTLNANWQLGAELNHWGTGEGQDHIANINILSAIARYYPNANGQFFLRGGLGIGGATVESQATGFKLSTGGVGMQLGLGYDFLLGKTKKTALSPYFNMVFFGAEGQIERVGDLAFVGPSNPGFVQLGVAFTVL